MYCLSLQMKSGIRILTPVWRNVEPYDLESHDCSVIFSYSIPLNSKLHISLLAS